MQKRGSSNPIHHFTRFLTLFALLVGAVPLTRAQEVAGDTQKAAAAAEEQVHIAKQPITVMVTARKEPETALSIPLSVTAVTEGTLRDSDIRAVKDAARFAPNVIINEFTARAVSNPFFRGIGGSPTNPGVSTFIDGVPQLNGFSSNIEMADVAQVEFVRGPGGSLYGRNTAGGFINIISRPASETWTAQTQGAFGNYSYRDIRGSVSSPLLRERFSFNLAGGYSGRDGYTKNDFSNRDLDRRSAGFGKAQLFVKLNEQWKIRWIFTGERDRDGDYALGDIGYIRENPNRVRRDFEGHTRRCVGSTTLRLEYQGDSVDFASISGGLWWKNRSLTDLDYQAATLSNGGLFAIRENEDDQHQFTQEFRFSSARDKGFRLADSVSVRWQAGVFIFSQNYEQNARNDISSVFGFFPGMVSTSSSNLDDWGVGLYGQADFIIRDKLHITAGLRFDHEDKEADLGPTRALATSFSDSYAEASPQFSVAYRFTPDQMAYVSVARGFKAGGFNPAPTGVPAPAGTETYSPEHTWNYEVGHKAKWPGNRLESTVALFYIDWNDLQLNQQIPFSGGQYFIGNAGAANSKGIEFETRFFASPWWELFGMVGYSRARFLGNSTAFNANLGINEAVGGNTLPYTPTFSSNVGTQISWAPSVHTTLYLRAQIALSGDFMYDASNAMGQDRYSLTSFRGGVRSRHWFAEGWIDNAFDTHYVPIAIPYAQLGAPSGYVGESGAPVTYGARLGINF
jgi:iron complex outermembrane receptor protein